MTPLIFGLKGFKLSVDERAFLREADPAGIILFSRNVDTPDQIYGLTNSVRDCLGRDLAVLIDQEGGRVQRLKPPHWRRAPAMEFFGKAYEHDPENAERALYLNTCLIGHELRALGINVDCLPLLDVPVAGADSVIGDRAFSSNPEVVAQLGQVVCSALQAAQILPVIKHIPGHGRAGLDSHKNLPVVEASLNELERTDFVPFRALKDAPFAMTAHVTYSAIDPDQPATLSEKVIREVIREKIGFEGLLISDDITMKALSGNMEQLTEKCLAAGIDLVLHCNADLAEMEAVMKGAGKMSDKADSCLKMNLLSIEGIFVDEAFEMTREYDDLEQKLKGL